VGSKNHYKIKLPYSHFFTPHFAICQNLNPQLATAANSSDPTTTAAAAQYLGEAPLWMRKGPSTKRNNSKAKDVDWEIVGAENLG
jgi:hypothetical protein